MNLNEFIPWQAEKSSRRVSIKIDSPLVTADREQVIDIYVYDYVMQVGQSVTSVSEIDLEGKKRSAELKELDRLREKYEAKGE